MDVAIDKGHSVSKDPGAVGILPEAKVNRNVAEFLEKALIRQGLTAAQLHADAENPPVTDRAKRANRLGAKLLISIHHNAGRGQGYEVIHQANRTSSKRLAELVAAEFSAIGQTRHGRGVYSKTGSAGQDYFGILRVANMPAIITEFAYVDSKDAEKIDTYAEQQTQAEAICRAVCKYFGRKYKEG